MIKDDLKTMIDAACKVAGCDPAEFRMKIHRACHARRIAATMLRKQGYKIKEIAKELEISPNYVK